MNSNPDDIRRMTQAIIDRLRHPAISWVITDVSPAEETQWAVPDEVRPRSLPAPSVVAVTLADRDFTESSTVGAYFVPDLPTSEAVVALASQLQDHAIEATWAEPLPACPGHAHPLAAEILDGEAVWVCPVSPSHHRESILK